MGWLSTLYETYNNLMESTDENLPLPIAHTTQNAQIEVTINEESDFVCASVISKDNSETLIPCSEASASRSGKNPTCHPLFDKLQYVAGDYVKYGGKKGDSFHKDYMEKLEKWCDSEFSNNKVKVLLVYLKKSCLISDLIKSGIIYCDEYGNMLDKWNKKTDSPEIFKVCQGDQSDAFVRFRVSGIDNESALWQDKKLQQDYISYYLSGQSKNGLCYVTGEYTVCSENHPNKIRNTGDKSKLISSNDKSGFTFRGRFNDSKQAAMVSYEVSQKAHNALKWLIKNQGKVYGSRAFVAWSPKGRILPDISEDSLELEDDCSEVRAYTAQEFSKRFNNAISGYRCDLKYNDRIAIIGLDAATTGRLSVCFYREMLQNEFVDRIEYWHRSCAWTHRYKFDDKKQVIEFYGAPSPKDIILAAFGTERSGKLDIDDKLKASGIQRIIHCITDGGNIPYDIVVSVFRNICHPQNYQSIYNWNKVLSIGCSVIRKYYNEKIHKEEWNMAINDSDDISYLCGRLLAVTDALERDALKSAGIERPTTSMRYFTKYSEHPAQTYDIIMKSLTPYINKLGSGAVRYQKMLSDISAKIDPEIFKNAKNLSGLMALGFYSQQKEIYTSTKKAENKNIDE